MKLLFLLFIISCSSFAGGGRPLPTAEHVDLERYLGRWYAVTSLPQFFTRTCRAQIADYAPINPQTVSVVNTCVKSSGSSKIRGEAVVKNAQTNAELVVTFDSFFTRLFRVKGDYTIIKLDPSYRYVLVGSKNRKSLWLLAREKTVPEEVLNEYLGLAKELGFPVEDLTFSRW